MPFAELSVLVCRVGRAGSGVPTLPAPSVTHPSPPLILLRKKFVLRNCGAERYYIYKSTYLKNRNNILRLECSTPGWWLLRQLAQFVSSIKIVISTVWAGQVSPAAVPRVTSDELLRHQNKFELLGVGASTVATLVHLRVGDRGGKINNRHFCA